jgi:acetyl esterase/lipase
MITTVIDRAPAHVIGAGASHTPFPALPAYAKFIAPRRGKWRRWWTDLFLRATVKRQLVPGADLGELREMQARMDTRFGLVDRAASRQPVDIAGVPGEWIDVPETRPERVLLYLHGGAFIFRFPNTHARLAARICRRVGARALMVDYRLAPEHRYPAAPDDCHAAYRWLLARGCDPRGIVIAGDSAGGNLALATLHRIKAAGEPLPAAAAVISPFVDFTLTSPSLVTNERQDPIFTLRGITALRELYAYPEQFLDPSLSPLFGDFRGLPPLLIQAGSAEMLRDEALRTAAMAKAGGVDVELELWDRLPHVFHVFPLLPQGEAAVASIAGFIGRHAGWRI